MGPSLESRHAPACSQLSAEDASALIGSARTLRRAAEEGRARLLLRGKNVALLCHDETHPDAVLFRSAAHELGANVTHLAISLSHTSAPQEVAHTARLLGRLYDAVECQGVDFDVVLELACHTEIAVYDGIASKCHPTAALSEQLDNEGVSADNRHYLLQAILLSTIS